MIKRASAFFQGCSASGTRIILPAQALAEYLVEMDDESRSRSLTLIQRTFIVAQLDGKASAIAAELQHNRDLVLGIREEHGTSRQTIKSDVNVLAFAIASDATCLYSEDGDMKALAQGRIDVEPLPVKEVQPRLGRFDPIV